MIRIYSDWKLGLDQSELGWIWIENLISNWFGFIRIDVSELIGLSRIDFWPFFIKRGTERFSDWFGMIRIGSDTDIGMNRNEFQSDAYAAGLLIHSYFPVRSSLFFQTLPIRSSLKWGFRSQ